MLVDTHCHLADPAYDADRAEVVARAAQAGVRHIVVIGESRAASERALQLAHHDSRLSATAGVHPHVAGDWGEHSADWLRTQLSDPRVVAAGEMGLDYHYDHAPRPVQRRAFDAQLEVAGQSGKAAVVHAREADDDVAAALAAHPRTVAILHSFSSGMALLRAGLRLGHYVSFSGMITFRSWALDDAIRETPIDRMLVETDGPYLAPMPHRGRRNEPAFVGRVAERIAVVTGRPVEEIVSATSANAARIFGPRVAAASH